MQIWEDTGRELMGMLGEEFWQLYWRGEILMAMVRHVLSNLWTVFLMRKWNRANQPVVTMINISPIDIAEALQGLRIQEPVVESLQVMGLKRELDESGPGNVKEETKNGLSTAITTVKKGCAVM